LELYFRDVAMMRILYRSEGNQRELIVTLVYLHHDLDKPPPTKELRHVTDYCSNRRKQLIIGCDANAHHILWGSNDINPRGESLVEYLMSSNLNILNQGNKPTFVISNGKEAIDLTLGTEWTENLVRNWHVSDEPSLSDHKHILFQIGNIEITRVTFRDPKRTDWKSYEDLIVNLEAAQCYVRSDVEVAVDWLQQSNLPSYYRNCLVRVAHLPRSVPWWSKELRDLKAQTRRIFNRTKTNGEWGPYKESLTHYNKEIRNAKRSSRSRY
jgi:hypothetical protein